MANEWIELYDADAASSVAIRATDAAGFNPGIGHRRR